jgi:hypothetical protein
VTASAGSCKRGLDSGSPASSAVGRHTDAVFRCQPDTSSARATRGNPAQPVEGVAPEERPNGNATGRRTPNLPMNAPLGKSTSSSPAGAQPAVASALAGPLCSVGVRHRHRCRVKIRGAAQATARQRGHPRWDGPRLDSKDHSRPGALPRSRASGAEAEYKRSGRPSLHDQIPDTTRGRCPDGGAARPHGAARHAERPRAGCHTPASLRDSRLVTLSCQTRRRCGERHALAADPAGEHVGNALGANVRASDRPAQPLAATREAPQQP